MKRWLAILLLPLLLSACSGTTFLYNRLDMILPWMLNSYVDLESEQKDFLKAELRPFLSWHRLEELPRYIEIIEMMEASLDDSVTTEEVTAIVGAFEGAWARLEDRGVELLMDLGEKLNEEQIDEFLDSLAQEQDEFQEKYLDRSDEEYYDDAFDNMVDSAQDNLGRLSSEQKAAIREGVSALQRSDHVWVRERLAWNARLAEILERKPGWRQTLRDAMAARDRDISPEYRATYNHNSAVLQGVMVDLLNSRTSSQDRKLRKKLAGYREDFEQLVAQGRRDAEKRGSPKG